MSSVCTLRLNLRRALSMDSPSCTKQIGTCDLLNRNVRRECARFSTKEEPGAAVSYAAIVIQNCVRGIGNETSIRREYSDQKGAVFRLASSCGELCKSYNSASPQPGNRRSLLAASARRGNEAIARWSRTNERLSKLNSTGLRQVAGAGENDVWAVPTSTDSYGAQSGCFV
jgi:hypothetical protein